jgi:hypothetical protein
MLGILLNFFNALSWVFVFAENLCDFVLVTFETIKSRCNVDCSIKFQTVTILNKVEAELQAVLVQTARLGGTRRPRAVRQRFLLPLICRSQR